MRSAIGNHPLPALMVGAGLGWLLCNAFTEPARPGAGFYPAREPQDIGQRISSIAGSAQESVRDAAERARVEVSRYSGQFQNDVGRMLRNPLAFGVAALAAGTAVGMSIPGTTLEND